MINAIAQRWRFLDQNEPKSPVLAKLEDWRRGGSQLALVCSSLRHHHRGWNYRGGGTMDTVSANGANLYRQRIDTAIKQMDEAIKKGDPPMIALSYRIDMGLETGEDLATVDPMCRRSSEMYPCELDPHVSVSFKLLPQWRGEPGDCISFALSTAKVFTRPEGDILYVRMVSRLVPYLSWGDSVAWRSYDANRIRRGIEASIARGLEDGDYPFLNWLQLRNRARTDLVADILLEHLMATRAAFPTLVTEGTYASQADQIYRDTERIRQGGSHHQ